MKNSIENIWKEGFLNEGSLNLPKINSLYDQKSKHLTDKIKSRFKFNLIFIIVLAIAIPIIYFFQDALWQGLVISILMLATAWFSKKQIDSTEPIEEGQNSYDYLRSYKSWLDNILIKNGSVIRYTYPLYFIIVMTVIFSAWSRQGELVTYMSDKFPDLIWLGDIPLIALISAGIIALLMTIFSKKIYLWDVRLMYGRIFDKLDDTIKEMEILRAG